MFESKNLGLGMWNYYKSPLVTKSQRKLEKGLKVRDRIILWDVRFEECEGCQFIEILQEEEWWVMNRR